MCGRKLGLLTEYAAPYSSVMKSSKAANKKQVASQLGVSTRTLHSYIEQGALRFQGEHARNSDLLRIQRTRLEPCMSDPAGVIRESRARLKVLESRATIAARRLGFHREPLGLPRGELQSLHRMADFYAIEGWPPHCESMWIDVMSRLNLDDLRVLTMATEDLHPWRPFYRFSLTLRSAPHDTSVRAEVGDACRNLYELAVVWCFMKGVKPRATRKLLGKSADPDGRVLRKLRRRHSCASTEVSR